MKTKGTVYVSIFIMLFTLHRGIALADENATKNLPKPKPLLRYKFDPHPKPEPVVSASIEQSAPVERPPEKAIAKTAWNSMKLNLYFPAGEVTVVDAKRAMVEFNGSFQNAVVVFVNPRTGNVLAGREADFYFETDEGIVGGWLGLSILQWYKSSNPKIKPGEKLDDVVNRFAKNIDAREVFQDSEPVTDLASVLRPNFFTAFENSSAMGFTKKNKIEIKGRVLQLDLESGWGAKASVWVSLDTREVVKTVENGKQTFPTGATQ
ncbi:MAG: hypothetical protein ABI042_07015 [Verrucomicrobiota bacterium]